MEERKTIGKVRLFLQFVCLCMAASEIYYVAVSLSGYLDVIQPALNITATQWGSLRSAYATTSMVMYLPGGWMADKFSARRLVAVSMLTTSALTFWFATFQQSFTINMLIFILMGIFSTLTFWAALIKCTRQFSVASGEGKAFGGLEGGRRLIGIPISTIMTAVFVWLGSGITALRVSIIVHGVLQLLMGIAVLAAFENVSQEESGAKTGDFSRIMEALKHPGIWMVTCVFFFVYATTLANSYMNPYMTRVFGMTLAFSVILSQIRSYFAPLGAFAGGFLSDRFGKAKTILIVTAISALCYGTYMIAPATPLFLIIVQGVAIILTVAFPLLRGQYYALMSEAKVPMELTGMAVGIIATIGYLGDVFMPPICGYFLDNFEGRPGFVRIYGIGFAFAVLSCVMLLIFIRKYKDNIAEQLEETKAKAREKKLAKQQAGS